MSSASAIREKSRVAITSVFAAIFLTVTKITVGWMTHSLGILSEAAHSGLDLAAALVTVFAVKAAVKPADDNHPYGHGKVENLSALFQALLLLATCVWIIWEAIRHLIHPVSVKVTVWSFIVIILSIIIDISRSRALMKVAKKHNSQALEADALHFSTDVWSSGVVLLGLLMVLLSNKLQLPWLLKADAIAALMVAGIVIWASVQLGAKTIHDLLDGVPCELIQQARQKVQEVPGVIAVPRIRLRRTGGEWFSDVVVQLSPSLTMEEAHSIADDVERSLGELMHGGDVVVHTEPYVPE